MRNDTYSLSNWPLSLIFLSAKAAAHPGAVVKYFFDFFDIFCTGEHNKNTLLSSSIPGASVLY